MKPARKEIAVKTFKNCTLQLDNYEVDIVEANAAEPVCISLRSADGQLVELHMSPPDADRFARKIIAQASEALAHWRPTA
jgi:hypothetical protein